MSKKRKPRDLLTGAGLTAVGIVGVIVFRAGAIAENAQTGAKLLYAFALILTLLGILVVCSSAAERKRISTRQLTVAAMMAALCYIGFAFFKIDIPVPGSMERTSFHLGNTFCLLAALLLGGLWGGLSGAIGMTVGDLFTGYITSAPKTFLLKLCIGLITGAVFRLLTGKGKKTTGLTWKTVVACSAGMLFNVIADPLVGYVYKRYLFGIPQEMASALAKIAAGTTLVNAIVAVLAATVFFLALQPALKRLGWFSGPENG